MIKALALAASALLIFAIITMAFSRKSEKQPQVPSGHSTGVPDPASDKPDTLRVDGSPRSPVATEALTQSSMDRPSAGQSVSQDVEKGIVGPFKIREYLESSEYNPKSLSLSDSERIELLSLLGGYAQEYAELTIAMVRIGEDCFQAKYDAGLATLVPPETPVRGQSDGILRTARTDAAHTAYVDYFKGDIPDLDSAFERRGAVVGEANRMVRSYIANLRR